MCLCCLRGGGPVWIFIFPCYWCCKQSLNLVFRSNKGAVGNSVTTILHNNYSEKPLTPKSSNQKPSFKYVLKDLIWHHLMHFIKLIWHVNVSFSNILKATVNDEVLLESGSLTRSQKNFSSVSSPSNNRSPVTTQRGSPVAARRREATEEEAERSDPPSLVRTLLLMLMVNHSSCVLCEGLSSRWTRQQL